MADYLEMPLDPVKRTVRRPFRRLFQISLQHPFQSVLVLILAVVCTSAGCYFVGRWLWAGYHYRLALRALEQRDFVQSRAHLVQCLRWQPTSSQVHLLLAQIARRTGDIDEAVHELELSQRLGEPADDTVELERMLLRAQRGEMYGVETYLRQRALEDDPDSVLILEALTQGYLETFHLQGALYCSERLLECWPGHVQALLWHAAVMERINRATDAVKDYGRALELDPENVWARLSLGDVLLHLNQPHEALVDFEHLAETHAENPAVLLGLASCRRRLGQREEAERLLDQLLARHPDEPEILTERGQLALEAGQMSDAEQWFRRALRGRPFDRPLNYALSQCLQRQGKQAEAREYASRVERLETDGKRLYELSKQIFEKRQAPAERCEVGILCLRLGREREGVHWLLGALQDDPRLPEAHKALVEYYDRIGRPDLAAPHRQ
jgi:tetratricopeptide (TPR) repeat protein